MTDIKHGRQLHIRTPGDTWGPVVTGSGQDPSLRSINIHDGTGWQTVSWGKALRDEKGPTTNMLNSVEVYLPNVAWENTVPNPGMPGGIDIGVNPNYVDDKKPYTPLKPRWVRLFYTWPRETKLRNPHWRIVPLFYKVPKRPPSTFLGDGPVDLGSVVQYYFDMGFFWPSGAKYASQKRIWGGQDAYRSPNPAYSYPDEAFPTEWKTNYDYYVVAQAQAADASPFATTYGNGAWDSIQAAGMIDFQAIQKRLAYPSAPQFVQSQTGVDFIGQYDPSQNMTIKRVLIQGTVHTDYLVQNFAPFTSAPNTITYQIYCQRGQAGQTKHYQGWASHGDGIVPLEQDVRYPADPRPQGDLIFDKQGPETFETFDDPLIGNYQQFGVDDYPFSYVVENPGQDNITFSASVLGYPGPIPKAPPQDPQQPPVTGDIIAFKIGVQLQVTRILVHLASPGYDTPYSTHHDPDATR